MQNGFPLKDLNTWGVGGFCRICFMPRNEAEAADSFAEGLRTGLSPYILGGGSNILVSDGPIEAAVIHTGRLDHIRISRNGTDDTLKIVAGAGYPVKKLLALAIKEGYGGLEFLTGIPGTIGGAVWGNAGAAGFGFSGLIEEAEALDQEGRTVRIGKDIFRWRYRECPLEEGTAAMLTSLVIKLSPSRRESIFGSIRKFASMKRAQPLGKMTAGCVFKNPPGLSAGRMLEECGCKGLRVGGAQVCMSHANFIENLGNSSSDDIYRLCELCREKVLKSYGVVLEYEIKFLGTFEKG